MGHRAHACSKQMKQSHTEAQPPARRAYAPEGERREKKSTKCIRKEKIRLAGVKRKSRFIGEGEEVRKQGGWLE